MSKTIHGHVPCQHCDAVSPVYLPKGGNRKNTYYYVCPSCNTQQSAGVGDYCKANMTPVESEKESVTIDNDSGEVVNEPERTESKAQSKPDEKSDGSALAVFAGFAFAGLCIAGVGYGIHRYMSRSKSTDSKSAPNPAPTKAQPVETPSKDTPDGGMLIR